VLGVVGIGLLGVGAATYGVSRIIDSGRVDKLVVPTDAYEQN